MDCIHQRLPQLSTVRASLPDLDFSGLLRWAWSWDPKLVEDEWADDDGEEDDEDGEEDSEQESGMAMIALPPKQQLVGLGHGLGLQKGRMPVGAFVRALAGVELKAEAGSKNTQDGLNLAEEKKPEKAEGVVEVVDDVSAKTPAGEEMAIVLRIGPRGALSVVESDLEEKKIEEAVDVVNDVSEKTPADMDKALVLWIGSRGAPSVVESELEVEELDIVDIVDEVSEKQLTGTEIDAVDHLWIGPRHAPSIVEVEEMENLEDAMEMVDDFEAKKGKGMEKVEILWIKEEHFGVSSIKESELETEEIEEVSDVFHDKAASRKAMKTNIELIEDVFDSYKLMWSILTEVPEQCWLVLTNSTSADFSAELEGTVELRKQWSDLEDALLNLPCILTSADFPSISKSEVYLKAIVYQHESESQKPLLKLRRKAPGHLALPPRSVQEESDQTPLEPSPPEQGQQKLVDIPEAPDYFSYPYWNARFSARYTHRRGNLKLTMKVLKDLEKSAINLFNSGAGKRAIEDACEKEAVRQQLQREADRGSYKKHLLRIQERTAEKKATVDQARWIMWQNIDDFMSNSASLFDNSKPLVMGRLYLRRMANGGFEFDGEAYAALAPPVPRQELLDAWWHLMSQLWSMFFRMAPKVLHYMMAAGEKYVVEACRDHWSFWPARVEHYTRLGPLARELPYVKPQGQAVGHRNSGCLLEPVLTPRHRLMLTLEEEMAYWDEVDAQAASSRPNNVVSAFIQTGEQNIEFTPEINPYRIPEQPSRPIDWSTMTPAQVEDRFTIIPNVEDDVFDRDACLPGNYWPLSDRELEGYMLEHAAVYDFPRPEY